MIGTDADFDGEVERELTRVLDSVDRASIPPWRSPAQLGTVKRIAGGAGAAVGLKLVTGLAVVAFAAAGVEAVTTGSVDPTVWGQQVKQQVATCKDALGQGEHGIGQCVSAFAQQHGQQTSDQHQNSNANQNHGNDGQGNSGNTGKGKGQGNGPQTGHENSNGHGKPSSLPTHP